MAMHVKKGDIVQVMTGAEAADHGRGKVLKVDDTRGLVIVEGLNRKYKHVRPSRQNPQGGRLQIEQPIHISNVLPVNPKTDKPTRVRFISENGKKIRVAVDDGTKLD